MSAIIEREVSMESRTFARRRLRYFYNGTIRTMDPGCPEAPHLLVQGDRVWHCGPEPAPLGLDFRRAGFDDARRHLGGDVEFVDLGGRTVLPGLIDAHVHLLWWAVARLRPDLTTSRSEADAVRKLREQAQNIPAGEWIVGHGWAHNLWEDSSLPGCKSLDEAFPANPVYLTSKCGHLQWVNSAALKLAGIDATTADPDGGEIERSADGRTPTGLLKETAGDMVDRVIGDPSPALLRRAMDEGQPAAHALGLTGAHTPESISTFEFFQELHADGELRIRVNFLMPVAVLDALVEARIRHGAGDEWLRVAGIKVFTDGSLGGRTALMYEPFEGEPGNTGIVVTPAEQIREFTLKANGAGLPMAIHAIGDKAVGDVLRAYKAAMDAYGTNGPPGFPAVRNRIEHLQVFDDRDLNLIRETRPVASMQPVHLCADMGPADRYWGGRARRAYACRTLQEAGCTLAFGSDAPVEPINPFYSIFAAVTRQNLERQPNGGWNPDEAISVHDAFAGFTTGPAATSGQTGKVGSLVPGALADFIVVDEDPMRVSPAALRDMAPATTVLGGETVYTRI